MKVLTKVLYGFAYIWIILVGLSVLLAIGFEFYRGGFWHGWGRVTYWFSPFNIWNYLALIITLLPGFGAYLLAEKLEKRPG